MVVDWKVLLSAASLLATLVGVWVKNARQDKADLPLPLRIYILIVALAAAGGGALVLYFAPPGSFQSLGRLGRLLAGSAPGHAWAEVGTWFLVTTLMAALSVLLPMGSSRVSAASICDVAGTVVLGPAGAMAVASTTDLLCSLGLRPWPRIVFNAAQVTVTVGLSAVAYALALVAAEHAGLPSPRSEPQNDWLVLFYIWIPALTYHVVNTRLVAAALHLRGGGPIRKILDYNYAWQIWLVPLMLVPFGTALVLGWDEGGTLPRLLACLAGLFAMWALVSTLQQRAAVFDVVRTFATEIDRTHPSTVGHSERLAAYSVQIAWRLGLERRRVEDLEFAAWLHNLGTLAIKHTLLLDAGDLDPHAEEANKRHPRVTHDMIQGIPALQGSAEILLHHQRHPDGSGYPANLGPDIPLESQILLVADTFDAVCTGRSPRHGRPRIAQGPAAAIAELRSKEGSQFNKDVVAALVALHSEGELTGSPDPKAGLAAAHRYAVRVLALEGRERIRQALSLLSRAWRVLWGTGGITFPVGSSRESLALGPEPASAVDRSRAATRARARRRSRSGPLDPH